MPSRSFSLDSLILSEKALKRYNGHHKLEKYQFVKNEAQPVISQISSDETAASIKEWLRPTRISREDIARWRARPAVKILMIETHNQFSANPHLALSHRTVPGLTEITPLKERETQADMIREIFDHACLPLAALGSFIKGHLTFLQVPTYRVVAEDGTDAGMVSAQYCSGTSWMIAYSYFHATKHTSAVMFYREGDGQKRREEVEGDILRLNENIAHPMLLSYIKTRVSLTWTFDLLENMNGETLAIEKSIGLATWDFILDREVTSQNDEQGEDTEIYIATAHKKAVERYNVLSGKLNNVRFRLKTLKEQILWVQRCNTSYLMTLDPDDIPGRRECSELEEMILKMTDFINIHLFDADALQERLSNQMSSLFHLTNQRDSRIGLAIADINYDLSWQGKRTNSAMKTLAFVNLLFLPGTFVASFFSTPIFNWTLPTEGNTVVVEPFVIYWTVCIVLTLVLCLGWSAYLIRTRRQDQRKRSTARQEFRQRMMEMPTLARIESRLKRKSTERKADRWLSTWWGHVNRSENSVADVESGLGVLVGIPQVSDELTVQQSYKSKEV